MLLSAGHGILFMLRPEPFLCFSTVWLCFCIIWKNSSGLFALSLKVYNVSGMLLKDLFFLFLLVLFRWFHPPQYWCGLQSSWDMWPLSLSLSRNYCTNGQHAGDIDAFEECQKFGSSARHSCGKCLLPVQTAWKICTNC